MRKTNPFYLLLLLFFTILIFPATIFAQNNQMTGNITYETIVQPSFESTTGWSFSGAAGFINYGAAPTGNKVLAIRGTAAATQTITVSSDGCFRFDIQAAQFSNNGQNGFRIIIDGLETIDITPDDISFSNHYSVGFTLAAGNHFLTIQGNKSTSFITVLDDIQLAKVPCWSDPNNWSQNSIPDASDTVIINSNDVMVLDIDGICSTIKNQGHLLAANNRSVDLDAEIIMVMTANGLLEWGQVNTTYDLQGTITLKGDIVQAQAGDQTAALMVMNGAQLQLHGTVKDAWGKLNEHANQEAKSITTEFKKNWEKGDIIVIASTDYDPHQAEVRTISSISNGGMTFHFDAPLLYNHFGKLQNYPNSPTTATLDQRAEVGLLSRNLKIRGDDDAYLDKAGGHVMVMLGSFAQVSGVEFYQMGQEGILGRYPFHWHLTGDISDQYLKNSSIHISYNRIVTVHSSSNGLIEDNVAYDHIGNGYFLENGDEIGNQFIGNLGILTRAAIPGKEVRIYDRLTADDPGLPFLRLPATFWITHPSNDFIGNVAAGSEGSGYWMTVQNTPIEGNNPNNIFPKFAPLGQFDDNVSHSTSFSNFAIDLKVEHDVVPDTHKIVSSGNYIPPNTPVINNFTSYKCRDRAIWMRTNSLDFDKCASGDNGRSTFFSYHNVIRNSLYVGKSENIGTPSTWSSNDSLAGRSLPVPEWTITNLSNHFRGHPLYDGPSGVENCHFADFDGDNASIFVPNTAATKSTVHFAQELSYTNVPTKNKFQNLFSQDRDFQWTTGLIDLDGSVDALTNPGDFVKPRIIAKGNVDRRLYDDGFSVEVGATLVPEWEHFICTEEHYGLLLMFNNLPASRKNPIYSIRGDGPATLTQGQDSKHQIPVVVSNDDYRYYLQYHRFPGEIEFELKFLRQNDYATFVLLNVPSNSLVSKNGGSISAFTSLADFEGSNGEGYFLDNNTLYIRLIGTSTHYIPQFGTEFPYTSNVKVCQSASCNTSNLGGTFEVPMADFENGLDERATLSTSGNLPLGTITANQGAAYNSFVVTSDGDGIDEYVDYRLDFHRQVWSEFNNLELDYLGPRVEVLLHDQSLGEVPLGFYQPTTCDGLDLTRLDKAAIDQVDALIIRVHESDLGDLQQSGLTATVQLNEILLDHSRDLWDFHRTVEDWSSTGSSSINSVNNGILNYSKTASSGQFSNQLFFGKQTIQPNANTAIVLRMKPISAQTNQGSFSHFPWGQNWIGGPSFSLGTPNVFNHYILQPNWFPTLDMQRISFNLIQGPSGEADVDYIRLTNCPTCYNGLQDGQETAVDCGGPDCITCPCEDGIQNNEETGIDCGGPNCLPCSQLVFERGIVNSVNDNWVTVNTSNTYNNMVVVATPNLPSQSFTPVVSRIRNITANSFELRLQNPSGNNNGSHDVHYFVVEEGVYTEAVDGIKMEAWTDNSNSTAAWNQWTFENRSLTNTYTEPVVLGQVQSYNDPLWSVFWASQTGVRNAPPASGNSFSGGKHVAQDIQTNRNDETIGFIAIESGLYEIQNQLLEAGVGLDNVTGVGGPQAYPLVKYVLDSQIELQVAVLSSAGIDGGDGGWPVLFFANPLNGNNLLTRIDEDQIRDNERQHTTEQVAYLAFGNHATASGLKPIVTNPPNMATKTQASTLTLYPNPLEKGQRLILESSASQSIDLSHLTIVTVEGKVVPFQLTIESEYRASIEADLIPGLYFVFYLEQGKRTAKKLVVHR